MDGLVRYTNTANLVLLKLENFTINRYVFTDDLLYIL